MGRFLLLLLFFGSTSFASEFLITETSLLKLANKSNPSMDEIEASFLASKVQAEELKDKFGFEAYAGYNHQKTREKALISFMPVFSNINQYQVGVKKYTKYGLVLDLHRSVDTRSAKSTPVSASSYNDLTSVTDEFVVQMDLWKDFMGTMTRAQFDNVQDLKKKDNLQKEVSKSVLLNNIRRVYWSLVANNEKIRITKRLYIAAKKQAADAKRRKANSISDKAEVAMFESLVHQRKGSLLSLEYERETMLKNLRDLLPSLNGKELTLVDYDIKKANLEVLACSAKIDGQQGIPFEHTHYDEITSLLRSMQGRQKSIDQKYDDVDLKFELKMKRTGVASDQVGSNFYGDYDSALQDFEDNNRSGMSAGLMLTIPFGEDKGSTAAVKEALSDKQFNAHIDKLDANVKATHRKVKQAVRLLSFMVNEQKLNSKQLTIRVKEMKKKYAQARIPEYALIQDENDLLQSDLAIVETQLLVVNTILDYLSVFDTYPCTFNRK